MIISLATNVTLDLLSAQRMIFAVATSIGAV